MTRRRQCLLACLLMATSVAPLPAQTPVRVKDANTTHTGSSVQSHWPVDTRFVEMDGIAYFAASDGIHGTELWRSDGSAAGTQRIGDLCPGACASFPMGLTAVGTTLYFSADDGAHGRELWKSDGTAAGTVMVADTIPGLVGSSPDTLMEASGLLVYSASDGVHGKELWRSDGTATGTALLKEFVPGTSGTSIFFLGRLDGTILFRASDPVHGSGLWKSDGTEAGTVLVKDIQPGSLGSGSGLSESIVAGGRLFFTAGDGISGGELWKSDGTEAGTVLVKDIRPGTDPSDIREMIPAGGLVYFTADDGTHGRELWKSDGTAAGTVLVKDIVPGYDGAYPEHLTAFGGWVYFAANDRIRGEELWRTDGTEANTILVDDISPGAHSSRPGSFGVVGDTLVFQADDGIHGPELWKSDGTEAETSLIADLYPGSGYVSSEDIPRFINSMEVIGGLIYFRVADGERDVEVYVTDGTSEGTRQLKEIDDQTSSFRVEPTGALVGINPMADLEGTLFFQADGGGTGAELWKSDGTAAGTKLVKDILRGHRGSVPYEITALGGRVLFTSEVSYLPGRELWVSDGTEVGTDPRLNCSIDNESGGWVGWLTAAGGQVFMLCTGLDYLQNLWKSDGIHTTEVRQDPLKPKYPDELTAFGNRVFFFADELDGNETTLWRTDGTEVGTVPVADASYGTPGGLTRVGHRLFFFAASEYGTGRALWASDGTSTYQVKDNLFNRSGIGNAPLSGDQSLLQSWASARNKLFFLANAGATGQEPWVSDGTAAGTLRLADIFPGPRSSEIPRMVTAGDRVYFVADDGTHGRELWVSDGTPAGTRLVVDLVPGEGSSQPSELTAVGLNLAFSAWTPEHGREPWLAGGRFAPRRLADIAPGPLPSSPVAFTLSGAWLYFAATDAEAGFELYSVPRAEVDGSADFYTLAPCRLIDTRTAGGALTDGTPRTIPIADLCDIPADAVALVVNLTAFSPTTGGNLVVYAAGEPTPPTSNLNFAAGLNRANNAIVSVGPEGIEALARTAGQTHLLVDVTGYFQ